jgi:hypothetical protein
MSEHHDSPQDGERTPEREEPREGARWTDLPPYLASYADALRRALEHDFPEYHFVVGLRQGDENTYQHCDRWEEDR